jgi:Flp pilus assembly protein CpaB
MRASTLFILVFALLVGVGTVFSVNYFGLLNGKNGNGQKKDDLPYVLIAQKNLFKGVTATTEHVRVRQLTQEERVALNWDLIKSKALPPMVEAAHSRVLKANVPANTPLMQDHFEDLRIPEPMGGRVAADHVVVYVHLPKNQAGGGIIQIDERVDVFLTTTICYTPDCRVREEMTAPIALNLRVVGKRDNLFSVMAPVDNMVSLHLEANHYRAAIIEYAKRNGVITLVPTAHRSNMGMVMTDSKEEANNAILVKTGAMRIGKETLMKIFGVKERVAQQPVPAPQPKHHVMQIVRGIHHGGYLVFPDRSFSSPQSIGAGFETPPPPLNQSFMYPTVPAPNMTPTGYYSQTPATPMSDPMEAFNTISFRQPDSCSDLPNSSKKG